VDDSANDRARSPLNQRFENISILEEAGKLPDYLPLWRYMKLSSLFLLLEGTSFFPSIATLRAADPLEGDLHPDAPWLNSVLSKLHGQKEADSLDEWLLTQAHDWERRHQELNKDNPQSNTAFFADLYQRELAKRRAVWCWFASDIESAGMWSIYGQGGVAVGTTIGRLKQSLPTNRHFQISRIRYADRRSVSPHHFDPESKSDAPYIHRPHFIKGREYVHEQEVRVATFCHGQEKGRTIRGILIDELIQEIVLSPLWPHGEAKAVSAVLKKHPWKKQPMIRTFELLGSLPERAETSERFELYFEELGKVTEEDVPLLMREL
jgi:hypothetical protein